MRLSFVLLVCGSALRTDRRIGSKTADRGEGFAANAGPLGDVACPDAFFEVGGVGLMPRNEATTCAVRLVTTVGVG